MVLLLTTIDVETFGLDQVPAGIFRNWSDRQGYSACNACPGGPMNVIRHAPGTRVKRRGLGVLYLAVAGGCFSAAACCVSPEVRQTACDAALTDIPTEMQKVSIPPYRVEPPDILS